MGSRRVAVEGLMNIEDTVAESLRTNSISQRQKKERKKERKNTYKERTTEKSRKRYSI